MVSYDQILFWVRDKQIKTAYLLSLGVYAISIKIKPSKLSFESFSGKIYLVLRSQQKKSNLI